jgi:uncharacterized HAD superfamily protein
MSVKGELLLRRAGQTELDTPRANWRMIYLPSCLTDLGRNAFSLWFGDYITMDSIKLVGPGDTINSLEVYRVLSAQLGAAATKE